MGKVKRLSAVIMLMLACVVGLIACSSGEPEHVQGEPGHTHAYETTVVEATCNRQGYTKHKCSCGDEYLDSFAPSSGHDFSNGDTCAKCSKSVSVGLDYQLNDEKTEYAVTGIGTCTDTDLIIPSTYNNLPVTSIGDYAFYECSSLTSVTIGDSVTSIGAGAFSDCHLLQYNKYDYANYLGNTTNPCLYFNDTKYLNITSFSLKEGCRFIGDRAFYNRYELTSITIPDSVISIGKYAFEGCGQLETIYYGGTEEQWLQISVVDYGNSDLTDATCYYYSENEPTESGNYWHYDTNGNIAVW